MKKKNGFAKTVDKMRKQPQDNAAMGVTGGNPFDRAKKRKEKE